MDKKHCTVMSSSQWLISSSYRTHGFRSSRYRFIRTSKNQRFGRDFGMYFQDSLSEDGGSKLLQNAGIDIPH